MIWTLISFRFVQTVLWSQCWARWNCAPGILVPSCIYYILYIIYQEIYPDRFAAPRAGPWCGNLQRPQTMVGWFNRPGFLCVSISRLLSEAYGARGCGWPFLSCAEAVCASAQVGPSLTFLTSLKVCCSPLSSVSHLLAFGTPLPPLRSVQESVVAFRV